MQVEHKTEKGVILFVDVPDDATVFNFYMGYLTYKVYNPKAMCNDNILGNPYKLTKFLERTENISEYIYGTPIKIDDKFILIGLTSEVTEEQAKMMVHAHVEDNGNIYGYFDYPQSDTIKDTALDSFKSLMQHKKLYEVNPYGGICSVTYDFNRSLWQEAQERTSKRVVLFKPN